MLFLAHSCSVLKGSGGLRVDTKESISMLIVFTCSDIISIYTIIVDSGCKWDLPLLIIELSKVLKKATCIYLQEAIYFHGSLSPCGSMGRNTGQISLFCEVRMYWFMQKCRDNCHKGMMKQNRMVCPLLVK